MATRAIAPPKKVWVGTYEFTLDLVPPDSPDLIVEGVVADGVTDTEEQTILVACHLDDRKMIEVVWHEITHTINWVHDIDDGIEEEELTRIHGLAWSQFWLDNPKYVRWFNHTVNRIRKERKDA